MSEGKQIVAELAKLKYEVQHDRELTPIPDDGERDVHAYNEELAARGSSKWHSVPWLYAECYLYRYDVATMRIRPGTNDHSKTRIEHLQANSALEVI